MYQAKSHVKIFPFTETGTPLPRVKGWISLPDNLIPGTPPPLPPSKAGSAYLKIWDLGPPPEMWTDWNYYLPPSFGWRAVKSRKYTVYSPAMPCLVLIFLDLINPQFFLRFPNIWHRSQTVLLSTAWKYQQHLWRNHRPKPSSGKYVPLHSRKYPTAPTFPPKKTIDLGIIFSIG